MSRLAVSSVSTFPVAKGVEGIEGDEPLQCAGALCAALLVVRWMLAVSLLQEQHVVENLTLEWQW